MHPILQSREMLGEYHRLISELREHPDRFFTYFRMTPEIFDELLSLIEQSIQHRDTNYRKAITPGERLAITLR